MKNNYYILKQNTIALIIQVFGVTIYGLGLIWFIRSLYSNNHFIPYSVIMMLGGDFIAGYGFYKMFVVLKNRYKVN